MTIFSHIKTVAVAALLAIAATATATDYLARAGQGALRFSRAGRTPAGMVRTPESRTLPAMFNYARQHKAAAFRAPAGVELLGSVIYSADLAARPVGAYAITLGGDAAQWDLLCNTVSASMGATLSGTTYYVSYQTLVDGWVYDWVDAYDIRTWELISHKAGGPALQAAGDMTTDPTTGETYGCFWDETGSCCYFAKADFENLTSTQIAPISAPWISCACAPDGTLYCIDAYGGLNIVDKATGECELVAYTPISSGYPASAAIDPATNTMYSTAAPYSGEGQLWAIDLATGSAELVENFPYNEEVVGLAIPVETDEAAPDKVAALTATFAGGSLSGTVSFTAPAKVGSGEAGVGPLEYIVYIDGNEEYTGSMIWGADVAVEATVAEAGMHTIAVVARTDGHESQKAQTTLYIGNDTPQAPVATVERQGDDNVIAWTLPLPGTHAGYVSPEATTYTVTRLQDNKVIAQDIAATTCTDNAPETGQIVEYAYSVVATFDGRSSEPGLTEPIYVGHTSLPFLETFDTEASLNGWTVVDHNGDTMKWMWKDIDGGIVRVNYRNIYQMDDYLFTPGFDLEAGKAYRLTFDADSHKKGYVERMEVLLATGAAVEDTIATLLPPTEIAYTEDYQHFTCLIQPDADGRYHIAFHGISDPAQYYLKLDNVAVSEPLDATLPDAPANLTVVPDFDGALKARIAFDTPDKDVAGNALASLTSIVVRRGDDIVKTIENPAGHIEFFDETIAAAGRYTYTVAATNASGEGLPATAKAFIGINTPAPVANLTIDEPAEGTVALAWDAPATDIDGQPINPALLSYAVADMATGQPEIVAQGLTETGYTFTPEIPGGQTFASYAVFATTEGGMSNGIASPVIPIGTPYALPFVESFPAGNLQHSLALTWNDPQKKAQWMTLSDADLEGTGVTAPDGDAGIIGMTASAIDAEATIWTGKIALGEAQAPQFSFQVYKMNVEDSPSWNFFTIEVKCDGQTETIADMLCVGDIEGEDNTWVTAKFDLSRYAGKTIQLGITCCVQTYQWTFLDDFRVEETADGIATTKARQDAKAAQYYNVAGQRTSADSKGLRIVRAGERTYKAMKH